MTASRAISIGDDRHSRWWRGGLLDAPARCRRDRGEFVVFEGFEKRMVKVPGAEICVRTAGEGSPVVLVHGFPQTSAMWHQVAPEFAKDHRVTACDLRGYGESRALDGDFSFRAMARDIAAVVESLGVGPVHLVAHDRGARTAHRLLLDRPDLVRSIMLLDILPTLTVWDLMDDWLGMRYYHWLFLAQPAPMPQTLIGRAPVEYLHSALGALSGPLETFAPEALAAYETAASNPSVVEAWCGDYAAAAGVDREHDRADLGRTSTIPARILWGAKGVVGAQVDPIAAWRTWLPHITGRAVDAGHFLVEETPDEVMREIRDHLRTAEE